MQLEKMEKKHYDFLQEELEISSETFDNACDKENTDFFDKLIDSLTWIECDEIEASTGKEYSERGNTVSELIDIICGPYDPDVINASDEDD